MTLGLAVLGSSGSVGRSVLRVAAAHPDRLRVVTLAARGSDPEGLLEQVRRVRPELVAVGDPAAAERVRRDLLPGVELVVGDAGAIAAATHPGVDRVVGAIVGAAGLPPVHAALAAGRDVALANKESLVVAGALLTRLARATGARLLPIDSEHAALHQALRCGSPEEVRTLVLTASGGPFFRRDPATLDAVTPAEALAHPTWAMGAKISIDSATLMNKGLELIEACHLFGFPASAIEVVAHPQSIVHSLVEFRDGSWLAQLSVNDMVFPVQYALAWPERWGNDFPRLDVRRLGELTFGPLDEQTFPAVSLARAALAAGDSAPAVLNAANEVAVAAFLAGRLRFPQIAATVAAVLEEHEATTIDGLEEALAWDEWGRRKAGERLDGL